MEIFHNLMALTLVNKLLYTTFLLPPYPFLLGQSATDSAKAFRINSSNATFWFFTY